MSEELSAFRAELLAEVKTLASADGDFMHTAFVERAGELLEEAEEIFDFASCYYRGTGSRHRSSGVDGYAFDDADESLRCVIAEFSGGPELPTLNQTTARGLFGRAQTSSRIHSPAGTTHSLKRAHQPTIWPVRFSAGQRGYQSAGSSSSPTRY